MTHSQHVQLNIPERVMVDEHAPLIEQKILVVLQNCVQPKTQQPQIPRKWCEYENWINTK